MGIDIFKCIEDSVSLANDLVKLVEMIVKKDSMANILAQVSKVLLTIPKILKDCAGIEGSKLTESLQSVRIETGTCADALKSAFNSFRLHCGRKRTR